MIHEADLQKNYGALQALKGISFDVPKGQVVGFLGPNGAGKTTTMKILTGFIPATSGTVEIAGAQAETDAIDIKSKIGYLPESTPLYQEMVAFDYLNYVASMRGIPRKERKERILKVAKTCGASSFIGQVIGTLSKGQRQRIGLAQALIHDPPILILDEPTSGLDPNQIVEIRTLIKKLGESRTILLSTHNLAEVKRTCDRVIIIHHGSIVADESLEKLESQQADRLILTLEVASENDSPVQADELKHQLSEMEGILSVEHDFEDENPVFQIHVKPGTEVRPAIHHLIVSHGYIVFALYPNTVDLESIFKERTQDS